MENRLIISEQPRLFIAILGMIVIIFGTLTLLAGLPTADQLASFMIGILVLIVVTAGIGLVGWHLLLRPLPANVQVNPRAEQLLSSRASQLIALILTMGTLSIGIAGVWDEIWHSKYGIPFGEDFFWRPHLMLYFGLTTLIFVGGWSWWVLMRKGKGTLQQRFRANPLLSICFLGGVFTIYAVGADPIWHRLYGSDIAPWSLPHLLILTLIFIMGLLAITFHKSLMPPKEWQLKLNFGWRDILITAVLVGVFLDYLLIFTIQWYAAASNSAKQLTQVMGYPNWLLAVFTTFMVTLFGTLILHATRQIGSATLVGILTLAARFLLDTGLGGVRDGTRPLLVIIPLLLSLDLWYTITLYRTHKPPTYWMTAGVIAVVSGIIGLPLMMALFPFLALSLASLPVLVIVSGITGLAGAWLGQLLGDMNRYHEINPVSASVKSTPPSSFQTSSVLTSTALYIAFAVFVIFFVATATPPV